MPIRQRLQIQKFEVWSQSMVSLPLPRARLSTMVADVMSQDPCLRSARKQALSALFGQPCAGWLRKGEPKSRFICSQESAPASLTTSGVIAGCAPRGLPSTGRLFSSLLFRTPTRSLSPDSHGRPGVSFRQLTSVPSLYCKSGDCRLEPWSVWSRCSVSCGMPRCCPLESRVPD